MHIKKKQETVSEKNIKMYCFVCTVGLVTKHMLYTEGPDTSLV